MNATDKKCDIGLIGLAVMGENLVLNMESHDFKVAVFARALSAIGVPVPTRMSVLISQQGTASTPTGAF